MVVNNTQQTQSNDGGDGQSQGVAVEQGQDQQSQATDTQTQGNDDTQTVANNDLNAIRKELEGLQSLVGKFSNEVGSTRELKEQITKLQERLENNKPDTGASNSQNNGQSNQQTQKVDPLTTVTDGEKAALNEAWKKLPEADRKTLYAEVEGDTPDAKQKAIRRVMLGKLRQDAPVLPDSLFDDGTANSQASENQQQQSSQPSRTIAILNALFPGSQRPSSTGARQGQGNMAGQRKTDSRQASVRQTSDQSQNQSPYGPRPVAGGVFEATRSHRQ